MTARLTAFYGVDPWRLLAELPMGIVRGLSRMLPRLQAERSYAAADEIGVGVNFAFEKDHGKHALGRWRAALGVSGPAMRPPRATPEVLQGLGISFRKVRTARAVSDGR
jgi:hypothetical protein